LRVALAVCGTDKYFGLPKYFYLLAKYLKSNGVKVDLIIDSSFGLSKAYEICNVPIVISYPRVRNAITTMQFSYHVSKYLLESPVHDIFHTCHVNPFFYLTHKKRTPVVFQPFGSELFTLAGKGLNKTYCKLAQPVLRYCGHNADVLLAEGQFQWQDMVRYYDNEARMKVLPVGIETNVKVKEDYLNKEFKILAVNSLLPYEGMDLLVDAFKIVSSKIDAELTIVGSGNLENKLKEYAKDLPVTFKKNIPELELQELYANSDLFVSTSGETDTQMGILEAEAAGLPIVSMGQKWLISSNGLLCNRNAADLADAIMEVYYGNRAGMGHFSKRIASDYDFNEIARQAIRIYETTLSRI